MRFFISEVRGLYPKVGHPNKLEHSLLHNLGTKQFYRLLLKTCVYNLLLDMCTGNGRLQSKWGRSIFRIIQFLLVYFGKNFVPGIVHNVW